MVSTTTACSANSNFACLSVHRFLLSNQAFHSVVEKNEQNGFSTDASGDHEESDGNEKRKQLFIALFFQVQI